LSDTRLDTAARRGWIDDLLIAYLLILLSLAQGGLPDWIVGSPWAVRVVAGLYVARAVVDRVSWLIRRVRHA